LRFNRSMVVQGDDHFESGYSAASKIVSRSKRPTAIFCNNDEMAAGAISAIFEAGLKVPEDISVAGFDNIPLSRQIWPPLTTVEQPISEIAEKATKHLIALLRGEEVECLHCDIPTRLVIRKSTTQNNH
jgi:DNA-binding LacI/PurR family transcriptional regulator